MVALRRLTSDKLRWPLVGGPSKRRPDRSAPPRPQGVPGLVFDQRVPADADFSKAIGDGVSVPSPDGLWEAQRLSQTGSEACHPKEQLSKDPSPSGCAVSRSARLGAGTQAGLARHPSAHHKPPHADPGQIAVAASRRKKATRIGVDIPNTKKTQPAATQAHSHPPS